MIYITPILLLVIFAIIEWFDIAKRTSLIESLDEVLLYYKNDFKISQKIKKELSRSFLIKIKHLNREIPQPTLKISVLIFFHAFYTVSLAILAVTVFLIAALHFSNLYLFEYWHTNAAILILGTLVSISHQVQYQKILEYVKHAKV